MPKVKRGKKLPPDGWELIEPTLEELHRKMRLAENESNDGKRKMEGVWGVMRVHHQRSRYIYDMYYKRNVISKEVYDYCLKEGYADGALIAKWKKVNFNLLIFRLDTRNYVVLDAFSPVIQILEMLVFVEYQEDN